MNPTLINGWYLTTNQHLGTSNTTGVTAEQINNATNVYNWFSALGWSLSAIAGMIGNMHSESYLSPAYIEAGNRSSLPNSANSLSDVPNSVMINFYNRNGRGYGIGLVQWDGYTPNSPAGQKLVSFSIRYGLDWYDGDTQCYRIQRERETNIQWTKKTIFGIQWTWSNYITNTRSPEDSADIWRRCYEVGGDDSITQRRNNARYWYDYFSGSPTPPTPPEPTDDWISGDEFSALALAYDPDITGQQIPYTQLDCFGFVQTVWRDIPAVGPTGKLVDTSQSPLQNGTNSLWRENVSPYPNYTFNTTSPDSQNPCPVLWYKDDISSCIAQYGEIPAGSLLFHEIGEDDNPQIPPQYRGDGIGNFAHVGIYCGNNEVMQSGGRDSSTVPGGGVHKSVYDSSAWSHVAFVVWVAPSGSEPPPPPPSLQPWIYMVFLNKKKGVIKRVKRKF